MERYEVIRDLGSGNFGVAKLVRDVGTRELYAVKFIERGQKIDEHVRREIMNHRSLKHPNIIRFKELTVERNPQSASLMAVMRRLGQPLLAAGTLPVQRQRMGGRYRRRS